MKILQIVAAALATGLALTSVPAGAATSGRATQAEKNKQLVLAAYQGLFGDHDLSVIDKYWAQDYIQHNPYMTDGRESVKAYVKKLGIEN